MCVCVLMIFDAKFDKSPDGNNVFVLRGIQSQFSKCPKKLMEIMFAYHLMAWLERNNFHYTNRFINPLPEMFTNKKLFFLYFV